MSGTLATFLYQSSVGIAGQNHALTTVIWDRKGAREAGVSQRTLFRYFGTKEDFSAAARTASGRY
ncbi:TetR family transcriptional regulator [Streptomyces avermitilis]|uniref:TetR family transcriptional regulator n=1 Tax=Streptomyces avermitilis TaxID=33903 RepID=UPI0033B0C010